MSGRRRFLFTDKDPELNDMLKRFFAQAAIKSADMLKEWAPDAFSNLKNHIIKGEEEKPSGFERPEADVSTDSPARETATQRPRQATPGPGTQEHKASRGQRKPRAKQPTAGKPKPKDGLLTPKEFVPLANVKSEQTIRNYIHQGKLVGWKEGKRGFVLPAGQLNRQKNQIAGVNEVVQIFGDAKQGWQWLNKPKPELDQKTPLDLLKERKSNIKRVQEMAKAAVAYEPTSETEPTRPAESADTTGSPRAAEPSGVTDSAGEADSNDEATSPRAAESEVKQSETV